MKERLVEGAEETTEINISPLIDMVFILLIFFIVTTVFVEESGLGINTPEPDVLPPKENTEPFVLKLNKVGAVFHDGDEIGFLGISGRIQNAKAMGALESITIEVHQKTPVLHATKVLDLCKDAKVDKITMKTSSEKE